MITTTGKLPIHICGMAYGGWADAEERLLAHHNGLVPEDTDELRLEDCYVFAWICILRFNLANLSLVDESTPSFMTSMAQEQVEQTKSMLNSFRPHERDIEVALGGLPSPTRQVRSAIDYTLPSS